MVNFKMIVKVKTEFIEKIFIKELESFEWFMQLSCSICK
jgi:hypothetical protein